MYNDTERQESWKKLKEELRAGSAQYDCSLCNKKMFSQDYLDKHLNGKLHLNNVLKSKISSLDKTPRTPPKQSKNFIPPTPPSADKGPKKYCFTCDQWVSKKKNWSRHIKTQTHVDKSNNLTYECKVCDLNFCSKTRLVTHLKSKKHKSKREHHHLDIPDPVDVGDEENENRKSTIFFVSFEGANIKYKLAQKVFFCILLRVQ